MTIYLEGSIWIFEGLFGFANLLGVYLAQGSIWKKLIDGPNGTYSALIDPILTHEDRD